MGSYVDIAKTCSISIASKCLSLFPYKWYNTNDHHLVVCQHSQFTIAPWSNTLIIRLQCPQWHRQAVMATRDPDEQSNSCWQVSMDPNRFIRLLLSWQQVQIFCLVSSFKYSVWILWLARSWEDFSSGWWHPQHRVPMVLGVFQLENSTHRSNFTLVYWIVHERPSMEIHENHHNCPWQYLRSCPSCRCCPSCTEMSPKLRK